MKKRKIQRKKIFSMVIFFFFLIALIIANRFYNFWVTSDDYFQSTKVHISIDDTIDVFRDLTNNQQNYNSIFENRTLKYLQKLHNRYGAVFSLYCYYETADFDLSQCTGKFAKEFSENNSWLKFGFHAKNGTTNLSDITAEDACLEYEQVLAELGRIMGGPSSIDTYVRLQNFAGNYEAVQAINNCEYGIDGLLTADDDRASYYLDEIQNSFMRNNDYYFDQLNNLGFVSTDLRLENSNNLYDELFEIACDENQNQIIEVFTHEWALNRIMKLKLLLTCHFTYKHGCSWEYPMYLYEK